MLLNAPPISSPLSLIFAGINILKNIISNHLLNYQLLSLVKLLSILLLKIINHYH